MREYEGNAPCPHCGFDVERYEAAFHQLRLGTILNGKYILGKVLGEGGFGISYLGWDLNLEHKVAIKEYYPVNYVTRQAMYSPTVTMLTGVRQEFYQKGLKKFVEEARTLAKFSELPGIVHVRDYFQENGTAYIVMEFVEGDTLRNILVKSDGRFPVEQVLGFMRPVIESLGEVHKKGLIHRDISPDNMMLNSKGQVKLLDFGAARNYMFGEEKSLSVILKPGFTPAEQYSSRGGQGPWTDVYALCATIYRAITGVIPPESLDRMNEDELKKPSSLGIAITPKQEAALLKGLAIDKKDRFSSMEELENALYQVEPEPSSDSIPEPDPVPDSESEPISTADVTPDSSQKLHIKEKWMKLLVVVAVFLLICFIGVMDKWDKADLETALSEEDFQRPVKSDWTTENGNQYEGFRNEDGLPNGEGKAIFINGDQYEGYFVDGYRQGHGKYTWENGTVYFGNYVAGKKSGFGILDFSDTEQIYIGEWNNNQREGLGILHDKKETYVMGVWKENKKVETLKGVPLDKEDGYIYISNDQELSDKAIIIYDDGTIYIGEVKANVQKRDGWGVLSSKEDIKNFIYSEGIYGQDGNLHGILSYYDDAAGDAIMYYTSEGEVTGPCVLMLPNGNQSIGFIENGESVGNWIDIDEADGSVTVAIIGEDGEVVADADQEQWIQGEVMCIGSREKGKVKGEHVVLEQDGLCAIRDVENGLLTQFPSFYDGTDLGYFIWGNTTDSGKEWAEGALYAYMQENGRTGLKIYKNGEWEQIE